MHNHSQFVSILQSIWGWKDSEPPWPGCGVSWVLRGEVHLPRGPTTNYYTSSSTKQKTQYTVATYVCV